MERHGAPRTSRNDADNDSENDVAKEFQPTSTVYDLHGGKINTELVIFDVRRVYNIMGASERGVVRASVADADTYTTNVFFNNDIGEKAEKDFDSNKAFAVKFTIVGLYDKAQHCVKVFDYEKMFEVDSFNLALFKKIPTKLMLKMRGFVPNKTSLYTTSTPSKQKIPFL